MYGQSQQQQVKMLANSIGYFNTYIWLTQTPHRFPHNWFLEQKLIIRRKINCSMFFLLNAGSNDDNYFSFIELNGYSTFLFTQF